MKNPAWIPYFAIVAASMLGAAGQLLLSLGAAGVQEFSRFFNPQVAAGLFLYFLGTLAWVFALSKLPLNVAYGFTALTFIMVYVGSVLILHERLPLGPMVGVALIAAGFLLIAFTGSAALAGRVQLQR